MAEQEISQADADRPWSIRRNGQECARATTRREADGIIRQLQKFDRIGRIYGNVSGQEHCPLYGWRTRLEIKIRG
jgi:hypothetical protein